MPRHRSGIRRLQKDVRQFLPGDPPAVPLQNECGILFGSQADHFLRLASGCKVCQPLVVARLVSFGIAFAYNYRGFCWSSMHEFKKALGDFTTAISLDPNNAYAFASRGWCWNVTTDSYKAVQDFDEAIRLNPKYALAYINRARLWFQQGKTANASSDYSEAV